MKDYTTYASRKNARRDQGLSYHCGQVPHECLEKQVHLQIRSEIMRALEDGPSNQHYWYNFKPFLWTIPDLPDRSEWANHTLQYRELITNETSDG